MKLIFACKCVIIYIHSYWERETYTEKIQVIIARIIIIVGNIISSDNTIYILLTIYWLNFIIRKLPTYNIVMFSVPVNFWVNNLKCMRRCENWKYWTLLRFTKAIQTLFLFLIKILANYIHKCTKNFYNYLCFQCIFQWYKKYFI